MKQYNFYYSEKQNELQVQNFGRENLIEGHKYTECCEVGMNPIGKFDDRVFVCTSTIDKIEIRQITHETIRGLKFSVLYASSMSYGYGHKKIIVELRSPNGESKVFESITNNMSSYDDAMDYEGQEKYNMLFSLVDMNLDEEITDWLILNELEN